MRKEIVIIFASLFYGSYALAEEVKLPDGTPAHIIVQTPCTTDGYKDYPTCIAASLDTPSDHGGSIDMRAIETLFH